MVLAQEPVALSPEEVLTSYATIRGFMATGGRPDQVHWHSRWCSYGVEHFGKRNYRDVNNRLNVKLVHK
jgi:hypothetical protein